MGIKLIIVDMSVSMRGEVCELISTTLLNEMSVFSHQTSQHAVMVACLAPHIEILYPLQVVSDQTRIALRRSIEALSQYQKDMPLADHCPAGMLQKCVEFIMSTCGTFLSNTYNHLNGNVDILFTTCNTTFKKSLDSILSSHTSHVPRKVTVLTIKDEPELSGLPECLTEIDDIVIAPSSLHIQRSLRCWLFGQDRELLTIVLPNDLELSCDILPLSIDITSLLPETQKSLTITQPAMSAHWGQESKIKLRATKVISVNSVCESVLFGAPLILLPSTHWNLEWDILESNQHNFAAFCKSLASSGNGIICENTCEIRSIFMIIADESGSALIKPMLCSELLLPKPDVPLIEANILASERIEDSLTELPKEEHFSPLDYSCCLHEQLLSRMAPSKRKLYSDQNNQQTYNHPRNQNNSSHRIYNRK